MLADLRQTLPAEPRQPSRVSGDCASAQQMWRRSDRPMQRTHTTNERSPLTVQCSNRYIHIIERAPNKARFKRIVSMANSFFRNAFNRVVEARERQVARYINGALLSLDDATLKDLGTSREELRSKGAQSYVF